MNIEAVRKQLKLLKLSTAAQEMEEVLRHHKEAVSIGWVSDLLEREIDARSERALQRRIERADFPEVKTLEAFDWAFNANIDRPKIEMLATLEFVRDNRIALFLGEAGLGKTHLALARLSELRVRPRGMRAGFSSEMRAAARSRLCSY